MLNVRNISKSYGNRVVFEGVNFQIGAGEVVGLLGKNGAGKTTLLKILTSSLVPSDGEVLLNGRNIFEDRQYVTDVTGYLPDTPPLYHHMSVTEYLEFVGSIRTNSKDSLKEKIDNVLSRLHLEDRREQKISELSHGYRQRLSIAQALIHDPKLLILDEPINGLDPHQIVEVRDLINELKGKCTILVSSHNLSEVTKTCDRIIVLSSKRISADLNQSEIAQDGIAIFKLKITVGVGDERSSKEELFNILDRWAEVIDYRTYEDEAGLLEISIDANTDIRSELSRRLIISGFSLLELSSRMTYEEKELLELMGGKEVEHES